MPLKEPQAPKWKWIYAKASFKYFSIIKSSTLDKWNHYSANHFSFFIIIWLLGQAEQYVYICHLLGNKKKKAHSGCNKLHEHHMLKHTDAQTSHVWCTLHEGWEKTTYACPHPTGSWEWLPPLLHFPCLPWSLLLSITPAAGVRLPLMTQTPLPGTPAPAFLLCH